MAFQLTDEQYAVVHDRGGGLLVSAAAGSGKTRVLVERLLSRVQEGEEIDRFLVITYTRAAAAELRGRIAAELTERVTQNPGDTFLRRQATLVYQTQISTIHAFCAQLLREEGHHLDLDADFRLCDEAEANVLMAEVLSEVLDRRYEALTSDKDDFAFLVDTMSNGRDDTRLMDIVLDIRGRIQSHPAPSDWLDEQETIFALEGVADAGDTPWGALLLSDVRQQAQYWAEQMEEALRLCQRDEKLEKKYAPSLSVTWEKLCALSVAAQKDWDSAVSCSDIPFPRLGSVYNCGDPAAQERIKLLREQCKKRMEKVTALLQDQSAGLLEDMRAVFPAIRTLFALVRDFETAYAAAKEKRRILDFSDLEHMAARLLQAPDGTPTETARRWGERYVEVMVDEYQDTNAVQNAIFDALTNGGERLFMVGDVKQSIYRFRLADPTIFLDKYKQYKPLSEAQAGEPRRIQLSRNFRSRPEILEGANYIFRSVMSEAFGEIDYRDDQVLVPGGHFPEVPCAVEMDVLDGSLKGWEGEERPARDLLEARFVAQRIRQLLDEESQVSDGEGGLRRVRPEDIVILLRSPGTILHHYAAALGEQDIPWSSGSGENFFAATEIQVALALLKIIDNPRQDVPLIAVLRSALYGFSADRLSEIRAAAPAEDFYSALTQDGGEDTASFLSELSSLRSRAGDMRCEDLFWKICDTTGLLSIFANLDEGEKRRENLLLMAQLARDFEAAGHKGLFGFLTYLRRMEESRESPPFPAAGGGSGVRILSIHRSKGLEFPVVFLAGLARQPNRQDQMQPILFHPKLGVGPKRLDLERMIEWPTLARLAVARQIEHEMAAEELRLLYVAMTRAQEKLVLTMILRGGHKEIERLLPSADAPAEPQALLNLTSPGHWLLLPLLVRPEAEALREGASVPPPDVAPGPAWDIRWEDATRFAGAPRRERHIAEPSEPFQKMNINFLERFQWVYPHADDIALPSKLTATQLKGRALDGEAAEEAPQPLKPAQFQRPRFATEKLGLTPAQRGTALHLVMQYINFSQCGSQQTIQAEITRLVDKKFLTPEQGEAVDVARIFRFFSSPLGREMMSASSIRREFKFSMLVPAERYFPHAGAEEQILLQGVVDVFFESGDGLTIVDFKTDRVFGKKLIERANDYRPQLNAYSAALGEMTGKPVARKVLWFFSEGKAIEV